MKPSNKKLQIPDKSIENNLDNGYNL